MRYEPHPDGGNPYLVVTPAEINAMAPTIASRLRQFGVREGDIDDLVQDTMIAACEAAEQKAIRGPTTRPPERSLAAFLNNAAFLRASNYRNRYRNRVELHDEIDPRLGPKMNPEGQIEARDVLRRVLAKWPKIAPDMLLLALGMTLQETGAKSGVTRATAHYRAKKIRAAIRSLDKPRIPKQPPRPTWKTRKKGR